MTCKLTVIKCAHGRHGAGGRETMTDSDESLLDALLALAALVVAVVAIFGIWVML